jgi:hypothetical protein
MNFMSVIISLIVICAMTVHTLSRELNSLHYLPLRMRDSIFISFESIVLITSYNALLIGIMLIAKVYTTLFYQIIMSLIVVFLPYLIKSSKFINCCYQKNAYRPLQDKLIYTSLIYAVAAVTSFVHYGYYEYAFLCTITTIGSILYHYYRETRFFNFDNIFATIHFFVYFFTLFHSWEKLFNYFLLGVVCGPLAIFALVYCGSPSEIVEDNDTSTITVRYSRKIYDDWHTVWHLTSGFGPVLASYYFYYHYDNDFMGESRTAIFLVSVLALVLSLSINLVANYAEVVPLS